MIYGWIIGGPAALDPGVKGMTESEGDDMFPRGLSSVKGLTKIHKNRNTGSPFGFMKERSELIKGTPLMVISAATGALYALPQDKGRTIQKTGVVITTGGAFNNLYDRVVWGYMMDYFSIEWELIKKVVFNLEDMFVFLRSTITMLEQTAKSLAEVRKKKQARKIDKKYREK